MLQIRAIAYGSTQYRDACALRETVLRRPLGMVLRPEDVADDAARQHFGAWEQDRLLGCVSLMLHEGSAQLKQMAVSETAQGRGVGAKLLAAAEQAARDTGRPVMRMCARETAIGFYDRAGYEVVGAPFVEVGLPHRTMEKTLG